MEVEGASLRAMSSGSNSDKIETKKSKISEIFGTKINSIKDDDHMSGTLL